MALTGDGGGLRVRQLCSSGVSTTALPIFLVIQQSPLLQTLEPPTFDGAETVDFLFGQRFGLRNFSNFEVRQVNGHEIVKHRFAPATIQLVRQRTKVICVLRSGVRYVQDEEAPLVKASRHYPTRVARHNQVANISHSLRRSELGLDEQSWLIYQRFKCSLAALVAGKERLVWEYDDPIL